MTKCKFFGLILAAFSLQGCTGIPKEISELALKLLGKNSPSAEQIPAPSPSSDAEFSSSAANRAKANAEIMKEMFQIVYLREPKDRGEFGNWVDTLNQGAS